MHISFSSFARLAYAGVAIAAVSAWAGCNGKDKSAAGSGQPVAATPLPPPRVQSGDPSCPADGNWKECDLLDRLVRAGFAPKILPETTHVKFLPPNGINIKVGSRGTLIAFFFRDTNAVASAMAPLDTLHLVPPGSLSTPWPGKPEVIRSANLVAAFFSISQTQVERVRLAITAGPPQGFNQPAR